MTDSEIVCLFMEPKPEHITDHGSISTDGWWWMGRSAWEAQEPTLDALHEVEAKLTVEQWREYESYSVEWWSEGKIISSFKATVGASAEQKIKALAAVLRLVSPASSPATASVDHAKL